MNEGFEIGNTTLEENLSINFPMDRILALRNSTNHLLVHQQINNRPVEQLSSWDHLLGQQDLTSCW